MSERVQDYWNPEFYDHRHSFVSELGNDVVQLLAPVKGESILDVGCGTGDLTNQISHRQVTIEGIDKSENMIQQALHKYPHIHFSAQDILEMEYHQQFDAVFSNAALHWVKQPKPALERIYHSLKPGGRFVAEFGGKGNVETITDAIILQIKKAGIDYHNQQFPWYFPSIAEYTALMEHAGFRVTLAQHFDRPTPLDGEEGIRNWVEMFATELLKDSSDEMKEQIISGVEDSLRDVLFQDDQWVADYKRLRVIGIK
ncbi:class I SAM-dependent methyltransferase [Gracilibacillus salinarum]|uniref:Methyltransferase domain-containing protein n=1 Tax=Gracilibacillus salinarum TaxID=2932255 RepID=A0ABY4GLU9_9BACI|nr:class I SAM-dependent methyltransferase [Gracilibacillus salinarum]UOQ84935.1 methyltransferase domain-containing protein [Gracilibacillus salinarum]